jgi:hypothetical protein
MHWMENVCRLIIKIYEGECTCVSRDNYVGILAIVMVLVHLCYRCYYCQLGNDDKQEEHVVFNGRIALCRLINKKTWMTPKSNLEVKTHDFVYSITISLAWNSL